MTQQTPDQTLTAAISTYGHTAALKDHTIAPAGADFAFVEVHPITAAFRRMVRTLEFDVCEMAITTYLAAREYHKPFTAIPVFLVRAFHHTAITYNTHAGIVTPQDLEGRRVGVRAYTVTTGVWARGILASAYGVNLDRVQWVIFDEEHVQEFATPPNVEAAPPGANMGKMLASGELAAAIGAGPVDTPDVMPLIPHARDAEDAWFRDTGIYPINHLVVIKDALLAADPTLAGRVYTAFERAKQAYLDTVASTGPTTPEDSLLLRQQALVGGDPLPYGIQPNRKALETIIQFAADQHILSERIAPEQVFSPV